jgi:6-phosphogluconolactonase
MLTQSIESWDDRRFILVPGTNEETIRSAAEHWIHSAKRSIQQRGRFAVALSGGSTPKAIYKMLSSEKLEWDKVFLFWSDERRVPPDHPDSNYRMAMESGLKSLPIPPDRIFRMQTEGNPDTDAKDYEDKIRRTLGKTLFDLVMLGVGEDGHTASLFPQSPALTVEDRLVFAQPVPEKKNWRMTLTFPCINESRQSVIYALGESKAPIVQIALNAPIVSPYPASRVGTPEHKALWILDSDAASQLKLSQPS